MDTLETSALLFDTGGILESADTSQTVDPGLGFIQLPDQARPEIVMPGEGPVVNVIVAVIHVPLPDQAAPDSVIAGYSPQGVPGPVFPLVADPTFGL